MIAALYVDADGIYSRIPGVDPWDVTRDARLYRGPWPVIAHPPCERWSRLAAIHGRIGEDDGCFASALASVETWGGVLEHPAGSFAWPTHRLPLPPASGGWVRSLWGRGWACHVEQGHYGHEAPKATWLYYVGDREPPPLTWGVSSATGRIELMPSQGPRRRATPPAFAAVLVEMARNARARSAA